MPWLRGSSESDDDAVEPESGAALIAPDDDETESTDSRSTWSLPRFHNKGPMMHPGDPEGRS